GLVGLAQARERLTCLGIGQRALPPVRDFLQGCTEARCIADRTRRGHVGPRGLAVGDLTHDVGGTRPGSAQPGERVYPTVFVAPRDDHAVAMRLVAEHGEQRPNRLRIGLTNATLRLTARFAKGALVGLRLRQARLMLLLGPLTLLGEGLERRLARQRRTRDQLRLRITQGKKAA